VGLQVGQREKIKTGEGGDARIAVKKELPRAWL